MPIDVEGCTYVELRELKARIEQRMQALRERGGPELRERFVVEAAALGLSLEDIVGTKKRRAPRRALQADDPNTEDHPI